MSKEDSLPAPFPSEGAGLRYLRQTGNIPYAEPVKDPLSLGIDELSGLLTLANLYFKGFGYASIAMNQFDPATLRSFGVGEGMQRIVCMGGDLLDGFELGGSLLINPEVAPEGEDRDFSIEGCGSLVYGDGLGMIVSRPKNLRLTGFRWVPGMKKPEFIETNLSGQDSSFIHHEMVHLEGKDVTSHPQDLMDFTDPTNTCWEGNDQLCRRMRYEILKYSSRANWLVLQGGRLSIIDTEGNFIEFFKK